MNFNEVLMAVEMVIKTGEVPLIIGESGIGKTSLIKELGNKNNYYVINIDGNLLKEGEIGGLPTVEEYLIKDTGEKIKRTVYAVHTKLIEIDRALEEDDDRRILLCSQENIKATPRSWERISKSYDVYLKGNYPSKIFYNVVKGNIGESIAQDFINFIEENKKPLITPDEIFKSEKIDKELEERVENESHSRLYLEAKNALSYIRNHEDKYRNVNIFSNLIQLFPSDLKMGIMQEIKFNYEDVYSKFLENEVFIEGFFQMFQDLN